MSKFIYRETTYLLPPCTDAQLEKWHGIIVAEKRACDFLGAQMTKTNKIKFNLIVAEYNRRLK